MQDADGGPAAEGLIEKRVDLTRRTAPRNGMHQPCGQPHHGEHLTQGQHGGPRLPPLPTRDLTPMAVYGAEARRLILRAIEQLH
ncbi:hypothetical protein [Streptomyces antibioticus]|uniref:hypothetical protein n=1 Tax=Streptomyces antibioticus TaxID=1890 RepID=UPI0033D5011D